MAKGIQPTNTASGDSNNNQDSMSAAASMSRNMLTLPLAIPLYTPPMEDVQEGGEILFQNFVAEEFQRERISNPPVLSADVGDSAQTNNVAHPNSDQRERLAAGDGLRHRQTSQTASTPDGYKTSDWTKIGRDLREYADAFADSPQGGRVRHRAESTVLDDLTEQRFWALLNELFVEGFSRERVVALFYYCALLLIRSRRTNNDSLTRHLFVWSLSYIRHRVCQWVYEHGGWERVLGHLYDVVVKVAVVTLLVVGIACGIIYIRKNL